MEIPPADIIAKPRVPVGQPVLCVVWLYMMKYNEFPTAFIASL
jgi:hypothetical protein